MNQDISTAKNNIDPAKTEPDNLKNDDENDNVEQETGLLKLVQLKQKIKSERDFYFLRKKWSWFIFGAITVLILSQVGFLIALGKGCLNLSDYKTIAFVFYIETFAQIIGLAILVVKFLFKEQIQ
jgi:ABC-type multidrug transport system fused ATPase/permease subunit